VTVTCWKGQLQSHMASACIQIEMWFKLRAHAQVLGSAVGHEHVVEQKLRAAIALAFGGRNKSYLATITADVQITVDRLPRKMRAHACDNLNTLAERCTRWCVPRGNAATSTPSTYCAHHGRQTSVRKRKMLAKDIFVLRE
jgi:hypothetical protein